VAPTSEGAGYLTTFLGNSLARFGEPGQYPFAPHLEFESGLRRVDAPGRSAQEARAKICLQPGDPSAYDGLWDSQALRFAIEAAAFHDLYESPQIV
jgi:hypothetical protein